MLVIIASAKTQRHAPLSELEPTQPPLIEQAAKLAAHCRSLSRLEIQSIMKISDKLTDSTMQRFRDFRIPHEPQTASPALTTFAGDVFAEIDHRRFTTQDFLFANQHLRILSGLYGILRPLDLMMPYRLEMGYKIAIDAAPSLYEYWSEPVTGQLNNDLRRLGASVVLNCASQEYSRAVLTEKLAGTLVTLTFKQRRQGMVKTIAIYTKRARGMFVDWFVKNRIDRVEQLKDFDRGGYRFDEMLSGPSELVFIVDL
ncbi:MAG: peroxide stress protein YaaA [Desulfofustis sp.]|nr:peroxide stress protein YaaA [Desulfofustis sp.]